MSDNETTPTPLDVQTTLKPPPPHPQPWRQETDWQTLRDEIAQRNLILDDARELLLTAQDEVTLNLQAERLVQMGIIDGPPPLTVGNVAPREGQTVTTGGSEDADAAEFVRDLFNGNDW